MLEDSCCCATQSQQKIALATKPGRERKERLIVLEEMELARSVFAC